MHRLAAPRQTQIDTCTDGHTCTHTHANAKQTHTGVWCPSFHLWRSYSLSLSLALSFTHKLISGGFLLWSCDTLLLLLQFVCVDKSKRVSACVHHCSCAYIWLYVRFSMRMQSIYMSILVFVYVCVWAYCQATLCLPTVPPLQRLFQHHCDLIQGLLWD